MSGGKNEKAFNVLMLGGRRCGKTSTLAMIIHGFSTEVHGDLNLVPSLANGDSFGEKYAEMVAFGRKDTVSIIPDANPGQDIVKHDMSVSLKTYPNSKIELTFTDVHGETMRTCPGELRDTLHISNVCIVAIDTPFLMEEDGEYNEPRNYCSDVCDRIEELEFDEKSGKKMVLFVPLKCEKYIAQGRMQEVCDKIKESYESAFDFLAVKNRQNCVVAITPIVTIGILEFSKFERDDEGNIKETGGIPTAIYWKPDSEKMKLETKYCEQLIYYLLAYILKMTADRNPNRKGLLGGLQWFANVFLRMPTAKNWLDQTEWILKQLKTEGDGYELLSDPLHFRG